MTTPLQLIPLGGLGEVGNNMTLLKYGDDAIMIDCGIMFPTSDHPGVDLIIQDITYLLENPNLLKAIFVTHGHEDHIGAIPFVLRRLPLPIYATKLTGGFIHNKLRQARGINPKNVDMQTIIDGDRIELGPFVIEPFHVSHSIPDAVGLVVRTPNGVVVHTGEYKFDDNPASGIKMDRDRLRKLGDEGVLLLLSDSTNAERMDDTPSESDVAENITRIVAQAPGRVIVATFASNIYRVQLIAQAAMAANRKIAFVGRSMIDNTKLARNMGYLDIPDDMVYNVDRLNQLPDRQALIVCTGTQGERNSALVRMSNEEHSQVEIRQDDTVIISATTIPGNEEFAHRTIDNLFRLGANVVYQSLERVHVSGHAHRDGQTEMISLLRPRFFIPIQGEYRMLVLHARLGASLGIPAENIFVIENGQTVQFENDQAMLGEKVPAGHVFVDGLSVGGVGKVVLRDRHNLSRDGFVTCVVALDEHTGDLVDGPNLVSRGFVYIKDNEEMLDDAAYAVIQSLSGRTHSAHPDTIRDIIHSALSKFFYTQTRRQPMIFPVVLEV